MKLFAVLTSMILLPMAAHADKICVRGDALGHENKQLTYQTKDGLGGDDAHFMTALNPKDDRVLRDAEKKKDPTMDYCIKGETKHGEFLIESLDAHPRGAEKK